MCNSAKKFFYDVDQRQICDKGHNEVGTRHRGLMVHEARRGNVRY